MGEDDEQRGSPPDLEQLRARIDELDVLKQNVPYLCATLGVAAIHLYADTAYAMPQPDVFAAAVPGKPQAHFFFDENLERPPAVAAEGATAAAPPAAPAAAKASSGAQKGASDKLSVFAYLEKHEMATSAPDVSNRPVAM